MPDKIKLPEHLTKKYLNSEREKLKKAIEHERIEIRNFLKSSSVWDAEYIYHRKALLLEKFDLLFPTE